MRILAVADEECKSLWDYYKPEKLAGVDMIVCCGDLSAHYVSFLATMAPLPVNWPTTMMSAALKRSCKMPESMSGMAKRRMLPSSGPLHISISVVRLKSCHPNP